MEENVKVSLIVPVFNVDKYLEKALVSASYQTFDDYEIIVVNDGSTDDCEKIIANFAQRHEKFKVINQKNSGLSAARNTGLKFAKGEYVAFLDSDDFLQPDFIETMYNLCVENDAEIAYCSHYDYLSGKKKRFTIPFWSAQSGVLPAEKALKRMIRDNTIHFYAWNKLYKRSLFSDFDIKFPDMYFEDIATSPRLLFGANRIAITHKSLYNYTKRPGSIMKLLSVKKHNNYITAIAIIRNFLERRNCFDKYKASYKFLGFKAFFVVIYSIVNIHLAAGTTKKFFNHLSRAIKSVFYCNGKNFKTTESDTDVFLPYLLDKTDFEEEGDRKIKAVDPSD